MITNVNKNSFETFFKQFNTAKTSFSPDFEKSKQEFEANFRLSKETMQEIVDFYSKLKAPTVEANKKMLDDLNTNVKTMTENNFKLWSELLKTHEPTQRKSESGIFKNPPVHSGNGKAKTPEMK